MNLRHAPLGAHGSWDAGAIFERFSDQARSVLTHAQDEARLLGHPFIGTEHILLGLLDEEQGIAAEALEQLGITIDMARLTVEQTVAWAGDAIPGSPPFTPRAKKVLELSLREALQLGHDNIGTEHLLLGLLREGECVGARVLVGLGADLAVVRQQVLTLLSGETPMTSGEGLAVTGRGRKRKGDQGRLAGGRPPAPLTRAARLSKAQAVSCSFCGRQPPESGHLVSGAGAFICEHCIREWHGRLEAASEESSNKSKAKRDEPDDDGGNGEVREAKG